MLDHHHRNILPKHQGNNESVSRAEISRIKQTIHSLKLDLDELKRAKSQKTYNFTRRLDDIEFAMSELKEDIAGLKAKTSDPIEVLDENEEIEVELGEVDYLKPRMGNC